MGNPEWPKLTAIEDYLLESGTEDAIWLTQAPYAAYVYEGALEFHEAVEAGRSAIERLVRAGLVEIGVERSLDLAVEEIDLDEQKRILASTGAWRFAAAKKSTPVFFATERGVKCSSFIDSLGQPRASSAWIEPPKWDFANMA